VSGAAEVSARAGKATVKEQRAKSKKIHIGFLLFGF
jgi:hypothetical protein